MDILVLVPGKKKICQQQAAAAAATHSRPRSQPSPDDIVAWSVACFGQRSRKIIQLEPSSVVAEIDLRPASC